MAADVSSLIRILNGADTNESGKATALITRDLLGGCCPLDSKELDLDMQAPSGWEKRLDLKSGKVYLQRCDPPNSSSSTSEQTKQNNSASSQLQDLNLPPPAKQPTNLFDDSSLDLKLVPSASASVSSASASSSNYQSICTLDKVKSALERAEKEAIRKRSISMSKSSSSHSNSSSSIKDDEVDDEEKSATAFAAGCPSCLLYVLISKENPKCPRCSAIVPLPATVKKPRIDLNISM